MSVSPNQRLGELLSLYQGVYLPCFDLVKLSSITHGTRQISNEVRNAHAHLLWAIDPKKTRDIDQIKSAFDHILRATIDSLKLVIDSMLSRIPPTAPYEVYLTKFKIEDDLYGIWDSPAHDQWEDKFKTWKNLVLKAIDICEMSYVYK